MSSDSDQHTEGSAESVKTAEELGVDNLELSETVNEPLRGLIRLGWLKLCQARLAKAWQANLRHAQRALMTCTFEVSTVDIAGLLAWILAS